MAAEEIEALNLKFEAKCCIQGRCDQTPHKNGKEQKPFLFIFTPDQWRNYFCEKWFTAKCPCECLCQCFCFLFCSELHHQQTPRVENLADFLEAIPLPIMRIDTPQLRTHFQSFYKNSGRVCPTCLE